MPNVVHRPVIMLVYVPVRRVGQNRKIGMKLKNPRVILLPPERFWSVMPVPMDSAPFEVAMERKTEEWARDGGGICSRSKGCNLSPHDTRGTHEAHSHITPNSTNKRPCSGRSIAFQRQHARPSSPYLWHTDAWWGKAHFHGTISIER